MIVNGHGTVGRTVALKHRKAWALYQAQGGICAHCFQRMISPDLARQAEAAFPGGHPDAPSLDRVLPGCRGGTYAVANLLLAHKRCNEARGSSRLGKRTRDLHARVLQWLREHQHPSLTAVQETVQ